MNNNYHKNTSNLVNLNKADREKLARVHGIGKEMADAIIKYRDEHNGFKSLDEIDGIEGFDHIVAEKFKKNVYLGIFSSKTTR